MTANRYIGSPVERLEDLRFLRGRGEYVDDLERPGLLHAAILRSPVAHGLLRRLDAAAALALPGVHRVVTAADMGAAVPKIPIRLQPMRELEPYHQPVLAAEKVRYVGEPVAVVLAESPAVAEDALDGIALDIAPLPAAELLFPAAGGNLAVLYTAEKGDADAAFARARYRRRESFAVQRHTALTMEPRGVMAEWDAASGRLTVYGAAKVAFFNRRILATQLGLPVEAIEMVENDVGGGFGMRGEFYPEDFLIPFAARLTGRPVKWIEDRREHLISANHAREARAELEIACRSDGTILALRGRIEVDIGAYTRTNGMVGARNVAQFLSGPYRIPDIHVESALHLSNKTPVGTYRGPGRFEADFFRERLLDLAAKDLRLDPVEFRRRNLVAAHEMPYPLAMLSPVEKKDELDSGDYAMTFERCLAEIGWDEKAELQGKLVGGRWHGLAIGPFVEGGAAGPAESARLALEADGRVAVYVGSSAVGQGLETAFAQIAADALELPMERIRGVFHGSTSHVGEGFGSFHSRAIVMGGSAILMAAERLLAAIRAAGAERLGCAEEAVEIADDAVLAPGKLLALGELAPLEAEARFDNDKHTYTYGAHAAHVAVDPATGHVAVLDYVAVEDVGRIINPLTLKGQVIGGIVQGLGGTFLEELVYDEEGQLLSGSLADYLLPSASDFPAIRTVLLEHARAPNNPLGAKGAGEGGVVPVAGVIANAVAAALRPLGVEPNELPLSPPRLWALIEAARDPASA
ncbi:MAG TPA: xanthine dehydrogenase family protein molybdopterin-binding subunit [Stellaceae bacterium]|nr:xanthine dehydrogenase family protein molybdopterin-binding subunit [Stellaceae bacterium]